MIKLIVEDFMERGKNKVRNSNIELLRIIAIIMVLAMHYLNENMGGH